MKRQPVRHIASYPCPSAYARKPPTRRCRMPLSFVQPSPVGSTLFSTNRFCRRLSRSLPMAFAQTMAHPSHTRNTLRHWRTSYTLSWWPQSALGKSSCGYICYQSRPLEQQRPEEALRFVLGGLKQYEIALAWRDSTVRRVDIDSFRVKIKEYLAEFPTWEGLKAVDAKLKKMSDKRMSREAMSLEAKSVELRQQLETAARALEEATNCWCGC